MYNYLPVLFYIYCICLIFLSLFQDRRIGIFYFLPFIPMVFLFVKMHELPLGKDIMDIMLFAIVFGWFMQNKEYVKSDINRTLYLFIFIIFIELINGYIYLGGGFSIGDYRTQIWKNYMIMPLLFFIVINNIKTVDEIKKLTFHMSLIYFLIAAKFILNFTDPGKFDWNLKQSHDIFVYMGNNHMASFMLVYMVIFLSLFYYVIKNTKQKIYYLLTSIAGAYNILFLFSRAAYIGIAVVMFILGVIKDRRILALLVILIFFWHVVLPASVFQRINMSVNAEDGMGGESDSRAVMWDHAYELFKRNPIFGTGFQTFRSTISDMQKTEFMKVIGRAITDTHSLYFNVLAEMGIVGLSLLLYLFYLAARSGWRLFMVARDSYLKGLGLGFFLSVIACMITNAFGDRWTPYELQGYYWMFWAMVERGLMIERANLQAGETA